MVKYINLNLSIINVMDNFIQRIRGDKRKIIYISKEIENNFKSGEFVLISKLEEENNE